MGFAAAPRPGAPLTIGARGKRLRFLLLRFFRANPAFWAPQSRRYNPAYHHTSVKMPRVPHGVSTDRAFQIGRPPGMLAAAAAAPETPYRPGVLP